MRYFCLLFLVWAIVAFSSASAQLPFAVGGTGNDIGTDIVRDNAGNLYVVSVFSDVQPVDFDPSGSVQELTGTDAATDIALAKYTPSGRLLWATALKGDLSDLAYSAAVSPDGASIYVVGSFEGSLDFDPTAGIDTRTATGLRDAFLAKYGTATGNLQWAITFGGTGIDAAFDVAVDAQDNVFISGIYNSVVDFDPSSGSALVTTQGLSDNFLACYRGADGAFVWVNPLGGIQEDYRGTGGTGVAVDNAGGVYVTGLYSGSADFNPDPATDFPLAAIGGFDHFVARYETTTGAFFWASGFGGTGNEFAGIGSIVFSPNGTVVITGGFEGTAEAYPTPGTVIDAGGNLDALLAGFDSGTGDNVWAVGFGSNQVDAGIRLAVDNVNELYVTGSFTSISDFDPLQPSQFLIEAKGQAGASDVFVGKYGPVGNFIWAVSAGAAITGAANNSTGIGVTVDAANDLVYATGRFHGTADFNPGAGTLNLTSKGEGDIFVWGLDGNGNLNEQVLCPPPASLSAIDVTANGAIIGWPLVAQAATYEVTIGEFNDPNPLVETGFAGNQYSATGLQPNTLYRIAVRSECGVDRSTVVDFAFVTTDLPPQPCPLPPRPTVADVNPTSARLNWTAFPDVFSYEVSYREVGSPAWIVVGNLPTATLLLENLRPGTLYEARVRNNCTAFGFTNFSEILQFNTPGLLDNCLNNIPALTVTDVSETSVRLTWAFVTGANFYELQYRRVGDGFWIPLPGTPANQTQIAGLQSNTEYEFRLRVNCTGVFSNFSPVVKAVTNPVISPNCEIPSGLRVEEISENRAVVRWELAPAVLHFEVVYRTTQGFITIVVPNIPGNFIELTNLLPGTEYGVRVRSICSTGQSNYTQELFFTTAMPPVVCFTPALSVGSVTETSALIFGQNVLDAFDVEFRLESATEFNTAIANGSPFSLVNLLPGSRYVVRIRNRCPNNTFSEYSNSVLFTTERPVDPCPTPEQLSVEVLGPTLARVSWTETVAFYKLEYRAAGAENWVSGFFTETGPILLRDLTPDTEYQVRLVPICDGLESTPSPVAAFVTRPASVCPAPVPFVIETTQTTVLLTWAPVTQLYEFAWRQAEAPAFNLELNTDSPLQLTGLTPGTTYEFRVRNFCSDGSQSPWSEILSFTTQSRIINCTTPEVSLDAVAENFIVLSWPPVADAQYYEVIYSEVGGMGTTTRSTLLPTIVLDELKPGTNYNYQVRSYCGLNSQSPLTAVRTVQTAAGDCPRPGLSVADVGRDFLLFDVFPESDRGYIVQYRPQNGTEFVEFSTGPAQSIFLANLGSGVSYEVRVRSICANGLSDFSDLAVVTTTAVQPCPTPVLSLGSAGMTEAQVIWSPFREAYEIGWRRSSSGEFTTQFVSSGPNSFVLTNLEPATTYEVRVRNFCGTGFSAFSNTLTLRTTDRPVETCPAPSLSLLSVERNSASFTWSPASSAFEIGFRLVGSPVWSTFAVTGPQPFRLPNLTAGTAYEFRVRNVCPNNVYSPHSNVIVFTTLGDGQPPQPTCNAPAPRVDQVNVTDAVIAWNPVPNAIEYEIERTGPEGRRVFFTVGTTYNLTNLAPGARYVIRVRTVCRAGDSPFSAEISFVTPSLPQGDECFTPIGLDFENITNNSVRVVWSPVPGATRYQVQWRQAGQANTLRSIETLSNSASIQPLIANSPYEVQVRAVCTGGRASDFTAFRQFQTKLNRESASDELLVGVSVYPNPTRGLLTVSGLAASEATILRLIDLTGKTLWTETTTSGERQLDFTHIAAGAYLLETVNGGKRQVQRIIIQP